MSELEHIEALIAGPSTGSKSYLFYGPGGTGKTTLAAKHPGKRKLWLDIDRKLREQTNLTQQERDSIQIWEPDELLVPDGIKLAATDPKRKDASVGFTPGIEPRAFRRMCDLINELGNTPKDKFPFDMICLDSGTQASEHLARLVLYRHRMGSMTQTLWGIFGSWWLEVINSFLSLPCDKVFIAHDRIVSKRDKDEKIIEEFTRPSIPGAVGLNLVQKFSEAYFFLGTNDQGATYRIQTKPDFIVPARTTKQLAFRQTIDPSKIYG